MAFEPAYKKPGDPIRSDEWNKIQDEIVALRKYVDDMTRSVTLTGLESPTGNSLSLSTDAADNFDYGTKVMGLMTRQYHAGEKGTEICTYGIHDFADILYYWSGATKGDVEALKIKLEYADGSTFTSDMLYINEWSILRLKSEKNPYLEFLQTSKGVWYRYGLRNPTPEKEIRYMTFYDESPNKGLRIANVIHYVARILPLSNFPR